ncbi:MAG: hypothetical protein FWD61_02330 [Phycisphaerales bacterium]|nr:hypothetical protein [Phycisphaerales bacterium]
MSLVFAAILPHGPDIIPEITDDLAMMADTRRAMERAASQFAAAKVDTLILLDPDLVHRQNKSVTRTLYTGAPIITVATTSHAGGTLGTIRDSFCCDLEFAQAVLAEGKKASFPVIPASGENGEFPLVGGGLIPLWYTIHPLPDPRPKLVVLTPSPGVARSELRRFGTFLAKLAQQSPKRIALVASADQGHTHDPKHPKFGFSPAAAKFDAFYCDAIRQNHFDALMTVDDQLLKDSWSDSLWVTLILAGLLDANPLPPRFFHYAVPTYFGMAVVLYE